MLIEEIKSRDDLEKLTIAQDDDDDDYQESGYIAIYDGKRFAIARYSHCSCYGTWTALNGGDYSKAGNGITWDWIGTKRQVLKMAREKLDPHAPFGSRKADEKDYDYEHLMNMYTSKSLNGMKRQRGERSHNWFVFLTPLHIKQRTFMGV